MVEKVKLREIIAKIDFSRIFHQKQIFFENLICGCHGNVFVGATLKSTNLAKSPSWFPWKPGHMTIPIKFNKLKRGTFKLHLTALKYLNLKMIALDLRRSYVMHFLCI